MSDPTSIESALFPVLTVHCFYGCGHVEREATATGSSDAMERHYWDQHYDDKGRKQVMEAGQPADRTGQKS